MQRETNKFIELRLMFYIDYHLFKYVEITNNSDHFLLKLGGYPAAVSNKMKEFQNVNFVNYFTENELQKYIAFFDQFQRKNNN